MKIRLSVLFLTFAQMIQRNFEYNIWYVFLFLFWRRNIIAFFRLPIPQGQMTILARLKTSPELLLLKLHVMCLSRLISRNSCNKIQYYQIWHNIDMGSILFWNWLMYFVAYKTIQTCQNHYNFSLKWQKSARREAWPWGCFAEIC